MNPNMKLFSSAAKAQEFWIKLEACGKSWGIKKYQNATEWPSLMPEKVLLAREPQPS